MTAADRNRGGHRLEPTDAGLDLVSAALLAALDTARWPDGSRVVDASDRAIQDFLAPALTLELAARLNPAGTEIDTRAAP
jgi:hypothetical protein